MRTLQEMHKKTTSGLEYEQMIRSVKPMCDYFSISNFYYLRILAQGDHAHFFMLGTHLEWQEYLYSDPARLSSWPVIRHPDLLSSQAILFKSYSDPQLNDLLDIAWNKFGISFSLNIQRKIDGGIEAYGFGLNSRLLQADVLLLDEFPLLELCTFNFHKENKKFLDLASEYQVEISSIVGPAFFKKVAPDYFSLVLDSPALSPDDLPLNKRALLESLGLQCIFLLTVREYEILNFVAFPAKHIANILHLSHRTVENHIANIYSKLDCNGKTELIKKAHDILSVINPLLANMSA